MHASDRDVLYAFNVTPLAAFFATKKRIFHDIVVPLLRVTISSRATLHDATLATLFQANVFRLEPRI